MLPAVNQSHKRHISTMRPGPGSAFADTEMVLEAWVMLCNQTHCHAAPQVSVPLMRHAPALRPLDWTCVSFRDRRLTFLSRGPCTLSLWNLLLLNNLPNGANFFLSLIFLFHALILL